MATSSIKSGIQLVSYKVDSINFNVVKTVEVNVLNDNCSIKTEFSFAFRDAIKYKKFENTTYATGLKVSVRLLKNDESSTELASGDFTITGIFIANGSFSAEEEKSLIKFQAPALLFPYLRASVTYVIASAGFPTVLMPIVNVNTLAHNIDIKIVEQE